MFIGVFCIYKPSHDTLLRTVKTSFPLTRRCHMPSDDSLVDTTKKAMENLHRTLQLDTLVTNLITEPQFAGTHFKLALISERSPHFRITVLALAEACQAHLKMLPATADLTINDLLCIAIKLAHRKEIAAQSAAQALVFGLETRVQSWLDIAQAAHKAEQRDRDSEELLRLRFLFLTEAIHREIKTIKYILATNHPANDISSNCA